MYNQVEELYKRSLNKDMEAKEELLFKLKPAILASIKAYFNKYDQYDDLIQEGYEVILSCIKNYDSSKGVNFLGYVKLMLKYHYLNKYKTVENTISLNQEIFSDNSIEMIDLLADNILYQEEQIIKKEEIYKLWTSLLVLTDRQREILLLYYVEEKSIKSIANIYGISYRTVVNTKTVAINKLRKIMKN